MLLRLKSKKSELRHRKPEVPQITEGFSTRGVDFLWAPYCDKVPV